MEARKADTGEVVAKDLLGSCVAAMLTGHFRGGEEPELLVLSVEGEVGGARPACPGPACRTPLSWAERRSGCGGGQGRALRVG
jgi:hypothetical protein